MIKKKSQVITFAGMTYRKIQRKNSLNRKLLNQENQQWLKNNEYKNIGWINVINLSQKIAELQRKEQVGSLDLENLFLEAERIGNKYFTNQEIYHKQQAIAKELNEIADIIAQQFPEHDEIEIVDYSKSNHQLKKKRKTR